MKPPLGSGGRFAAMVASGKSPALAAWIGRKTYGAKKFGELGAQGRHDSALDKAKKRLRGY